MTNNINISVLLSACITSDRRAGSHQGRSNEHILCCLEIAGRKRNDRHVLYVQKLWVGSPSGGGGNLAFLARKGDGARPCSAAPAGSGRRRPMEHQKCAAGITATRTYCVLRRWTCMHAASHCHPLRTVANGT